MKDKFSSLATSTGWTAKIPNVDKPLQVVAWALKENDGQLYALVFKPNEDAITAIPQDGKTQFVFTKA